MRYHKIAEQPKRIQPGDEERHHYSELEVADEALRLLLAELHHRHQTGTVTQFDMDKAHVALKTLYRIEEHHKQARDGRPRYPPFSWTMIKYFAGTPPFTYQEYSTPQLGSGGPGHKTDASNPVAPATPTQEDTA